MHLKCESAPCASCSTTSASTTRSGRRCGPLLRRSAYGRDAPALGPCGRARRRASALLHDIGKLDISRQILYKAARLTESEFEEIQKHVEKGISLLEPVGGSLRRSLSHHDKFDGSGYHPTHGEDIPLEARIITVADVFDSLTSDRPYRKAMSPFEVREILTKGAGTEFDPKVVEAFLSAFKKGEMEIPALLV
jgi:HD-GYP domain-containing protein (c-di-GMP phosphodiesterase class II)